MDICNLEEIEKIITDDRPDVVINCAAYTKVDDCEKNIDTAYQINAIGPLNLALACRKYNCQLMHMSTDYIFNGRGKRPYKETDKPDPLNIYGKSKLLGEQSIQNIYSKHYIIRTSWLYGKYGKNFVKTMIDLMNNKDTVNVVSDQIGSPTYVGDLMKVIDSLLQSNRYGIYNISNEGECSWYEFAKEIALNINNKEGSIVPILTQNLNQPAERPNYSVLDKNKIKEIINITMPTWQSSLKKFIRNEYNK